MYLVCLGRGKQIILSRYMTDATKKLRLSVYKTGGVCKLVAGIPTVPTYTCDTVAAPYTILFLLFIVTDYMRNTQYTGSTDLPLLGASSKAFTLYNC